MNEKIVVMMSGGLDSTVLFYQLNKQGYDITPLFVNYGQHTSNRELSSIRMILPPRQLRKLKIIQIDNLYCDTSSPLIVEKNLWEEIVNDKDLYLPYRNLVLFSIAVAYAQTIGVDSVYAGFINTHFAKEIDSSVHFLNSLNQLASTINNVKIIMPFEKMTKKQVVRLGIELDAPIGVTYSCQVNSKIPCGACPNCVERLEALDYYEK